jgi:hypothetical protein
MSARPVGQLTDRVGLRALRRSSLRGRLFGRACEHVQCRTAELQAGRGAERGGENRRVVGERNLLPSARKGDSGLAASRDGFGLRYGSLRPATLLPIPAQGVFMTAEVLRANAQVVSERFDDEVVLIDIDKGLYFSLLGSAVDLWAQFDQPRHIDHVISVFQQRYDGVGVDDLRSAVGAFMEHDLLQPAPGGAATSAMPTPSLETFASPKVEVYRDLAELIAFDPVHEVDQAVGWPVRPAEYAQA